MAACVRLGLCTPAVTSSSGLGLNEGAEKLYEGDCTLMPVMGSAREYALLMVIMGVGGPKYDMVCQYTLVA